MLRFSFMALLAAANYSPDISIYDSRTDSKKVWMLIDDCPVELEKSKLKNMKYVESEIKRICHIDLSLPGKLTN